MQDFAGGHVKGCINITVDAFEDDDEVDSIIDKQLKGKEQVVVHCALSQQRGPFAARRLASRLAARDQALPKVQVLEHGFGGFVRKFSKDPELCEGVEQ
eukprot:jgi/Astpho2/8573/Aster-x1531